MRLRLKQVAAHAGVSEATVSRVLNGRRGVAAETREQVERALQALGYDGRRSEQGSGLVGVIMPELTNPIFPAFVHAIEKRLASQGFTTLVCTSTAEGRQEDDYVEKLLDLRVDGIVFVSGFHANSGASHKRYELLLARGLPIALINGPVAGMTASFFSTDDAEASRLAVDHLVGLGHERIGLIVGPERFTPAGRKIDGFVRAMTELTGDVSHDCIVQGLFSAEAGQLAMNQLVDQGVTGVVCGSDVTALGAVWAARQRGLGVPDDISIVGYDDSPLLVFTDPPLTTVRQPVEAIAAATVQSLVNEIRLGERHPGEYLFRPELVDRGSTARPQKRSRRTTTQPRKTVSAAR